jgi:hypothetical protein
MDSQKVKRLTDISISMPYQIHLLGHCIYPRKIYIDILIDVIGNVIIYIYIFVEYLTTLYQMRGLRAQTPTT